MRKSNKERVWEIDFLRGLPIIGLLLYHLGYDICLLPTVFSNFYSIGNFGIQNFVNTVTHILASNVVDSLVPVFAGTFLLVTGISCSFSRSNVGRGLKILGFSLVITLVTSLLSMFFKIDLVICMGILHCMGLTVLVYGLIEWLLAKISLKTPDYLPFMFGLAALAIGVIIRTNTEIAYPEFDIKNLPAVIFGFTGSATDWFPVFPWSGVILIGISVGRWFYPQRKSVFPRSDCVMWKPITFLGRHTLIIYLGHQLVYILTLATIFLSLGYRF